MPVLLVRGLASIFSLQYWPQAREHPTRDACRCSSGSMTAAMVLLVVARDGLLFLFGWETMAVSAFFLVATEDHLADARQAAWLYIAASHFATLCAFGVFALLYSQTGSFEYATLPNSTSTAAVCIAVLALVGFGTKAGLMPMHVWLPGADASAPSHVSAVMSGVMIKMGIYGIFRVASFFAEIPLSWGLVTLAVGTISAILGVAFAVGQHDIKRLLAYHSIENIGIIVMGLGLALIGRAMGRPEWVLLGICGGLLHVWNHALFKSLLFFRRRLGHSQHGNARLGRDGWPGTPHAGHSELLSDWRGCDLRPSSTQWFRFRTIDLHRPVQNDSTFSGRRNRIAGIGCRLCRSGLGIGGGIGRRLFREGLWHCVFGSGAWRKSGPRD